MVSQTTAKRVLEIGVYSGAAVLAFAEYFESAIVDGLDITLNNVRFGRNNPCVKYTIGDGCSPEVARALREARADGAPFDVVVEDASHIPEHQIRTLDAFAPHLARDGVYIIEDIPHVDVLPHLQAVADKHGMKMTVHDLRSRNPDVFDDIIAVFTFLEK